MGAFNSSDFYTVFITPLTNHAGFDGVVSDGHCTIDIIEGGKETIPFQEKKMISHIL